MRQPLVLLILVLASAGLIACRDAPRADGDEAVAVLTSPAPLPEFPCVPFQQLRRHLPSKVEGLEQIRDEGSSGRYGEVSISEAERSFKGIGGQEISIRIVDTTIVDQLGRALRSAAGESSSPIQRDNALGFVHFLPESKRAEANLLVANRFMVAINGQGYEDPAQVRRIAEQFDVDGLALLR
ncbi:MAG: hypothetical protein WBV82_19585 [Myxococcaceae bacterium]